MDKYVSIIKNHRKPFLVLFILVNLLSVFGLFRLRINPDFDIFMLENSRYEQVLNEMNETFGTSDQIIVLIETGENEITNELIHSFRKIQAYLEKINNIKLVNGPTPETISIGKMSIDLEQSLSPAELKFLKKHFAGMGKLSTLIKKNNKIYGTFTIFPEINFNNENLNSLENFLTENKYTYYITGDMYMQQKIIDYILMILLFLPPTALILILAVFRTQMGSLKATFFSILPAGIAALWTMGIVGWIGKPVSIITVLAPIFTIVIGSADGLHFISHVQDAQAEGKKHLRSIVETLRMVGIPMIITTVTSMAGFLSLLIMNTDAIKDLAFFASLGILLAGVATWYILPLILTGDIRLKKPENKVQLFTTRIKKIWGTPSIIILIVILIVAIWGTQSLTTEFNQLLVYRNYTDVYQSFKKIMEINDGSIPLYLYIKTKENPLKPEYGNKLIELENELVDSKYVNKVISVYDAYSLINSSMSGTNKPLYPETMNQVNFINQIITTENDPTTHLINKDKQATRMMIFPSNLKNKTLDAIQNRIEKFNKSSKSIVVQITGAQYLMRELNKNMISNQSKSIILALCLIFMLLLISLKKIKPTVISLLPITFTILIIFGFMGLTGISLNLFTATIFSITIGVGIDYAVHFTSVWMSFYKKEGEAKLATDKAYSYTARPIMANAFGLAIGLSALLFSPLRIHLYVSLLMWVAMISGVFLSLSFLPTLLRKISFK